MTRDEEDALVETIATRWPDVQESIAAENPRLGRALEKSRPALISRNGTLVVDVKYLNNCDYANTQAALIAAHITKITGHTYPVFCDWPMEPI